MADLKISQLTDGVSIGTADTLVAVRGGNNVKIPANKLANTVWLTGRNAAGSGDVNMLRVNSSDQIEINASIIIGSGDDVQHYVTGVADTLYVVRGTAGSPWTSGAGPQVKISKTENVLESAMPAGIGANNEGNAALYVISKGLAATQAQVTAGMFVAESASTQNTHNDDACAMNVQASITGSGTGTALAAYMEGRIDTNTGGTCPLELRSANYTATDGAYNPTGFSGTVGLLVGAGGNTGRISGVGIEFHTSNSGQWDVGIGFPKIGGISPIKNTSFRDDADSLTSILINGTHATAAIKVASGSGHIVFGGAEAAVTYMTVISDADANSALKVVSHSATQSSAPFQVTTSAGANLFFVGSTGTIGLVNQSWIASRNAANSAYVNMLRLNASDFIEFGAAVDGISLRAGANLILDTATGTMIGTAVGQKWAAHGATPVIQRAGAAQVAVATTGATNTTPFGFTTAAQADALVTLVNELRATLVEKGIMKGAA